jgi:hypothetical protein
MDVLFVVNQAGFFERSKLQEIQDIKAQEALLNQSGSPSNGKSRNADDDFGPIDTGGSIFIP